MNLLRCRLWVVFLAGTLFATPAFAHGHGLYAVFVGIPLAAIVFIISFLVMRKLFAYPPIWLRWPAIIILFPMWMIVYCAICAVMLDDCAICSAMLLYFSVYSYAQEKIICISLALIPLVITLMTWLLLKRKSD